MSSEIIAFHVISVLEYCFCRRSNKNTARKLYINSVESDKRKIEIIYVARHAGLFTMKNAGTHFLAYTELEVTTQDLRAWESNAKGKRRTQATV